MRQGNNFDVDEQAEAVALFVAAPKVAHPVKLDVMARLLPLLDVLVMVVGKILGHQAVDGQGEELVSRILEQLMGIPTGPLDLAVLLSDHAGGFGPEELQTVEFKIG